MSELVRPTLLLVDDDPSNLEGYALGFTRQPYRVLEASSGEKALELLRDEKIDVVLTDLRMPGMDGLELVNAARAMPDPPVCIVVTAYGTVESAVEAMRCGAFDYVTKPVNLMELRAKVEKALEHRGLRLQNTKLQREVNERFRFEGVIGVSNAMRAVLDQARAVADSRASVLIEGESGTGKELLAKAIHANSPRAGNAFVPIHCAAIPESLLESELFGHEKGSFTGAIQRRIGQFESAHGGTVFLDEVSEIPLSTQVKLLRVLEQREIMRVGGGQTLALDIRLVAATNRNLAEAVKQGSFREDLFFRLNVVRIQIPPLRQRPEDIPPLIHHFLKTLASENNRPIPVLSRPALECLMRYEWPGNIRELRNVMEQIIVFSRGQNIELNDLPSFIPRPECSVRVPPARSDPRQIPTGLEEDATDIFIVDDRLTMQDLERSYMQHILQKVGSNRTRAAERLGISRRTLQRKLKELGMENNEDANMSHSNEPLEK